MRFTRTLMTAATLAVLAMILTAHARADETADRLAALTKTVRPAMVNVKFVLVRKTGDQTRRVPGNTRGVVVDSKGLVVTLGEIYPRTADRVIGTAAVDPPAEIKVLLHDEREIEAEFVGKDYDANLAFVRMKTPPKGIKPLPLAPKGALAVGQQVTMFSLLPTQYGGGAWFSQVRISAGVTDPREIFFSSIQPTQMLGGPVMDLATGRMLGVVAVDSRMVRPANNPDADPRRASAAVIVPSWVVAPLVAKPPSVRPAKQDGWLGIGMAPLDKDLAEALGLPVKAGVMVSRVYPGTPAAKGGLKAEDIIAALDGEALDVAKEEDFIEFRKKIVAAGAGAKVTFTVYRGGAKQDVAVTLAPTPKSAIEAVRSKLDDFGLTVREIVFTDKIAPGRDQSLTGVVVVKIDGAGWAGLGGLRPGDVVQKLNDKPVTNIKAFNALIAGVRKAKTKEVVFLVLRGAETAFLRVQPQWK